MVGINRCAVVAVAQGDLRFDIGNILACAAYAVSKAGGIAVYIAAVDVHICMILGTCTDACAEGLHSLICAAGGIDCSAVYGDHAILRNK